MGRKTVSVASVLEMANFAMERSNLSQLEKRGIGHIIESILHESGNYNGFSFVNPDEPETKFYYPSKSINSEYVDCVVERSNQGGLR